MDRHSADALQKAEEAIIEAFDPARGKDAADSFHLELMRDLYLLMFNMHEKGHQRGVPNGCRGIRTIQVNVLMQVLAGEAAMLVEAGIINPDILCDYIKMCIKAELGSASMEDFNSAADSMQDRMMQEYAQRRAQP